MATQPKLIRKMIDGLPAIVHEQFLLDPFSSTLFVYCNHRRGELKILHWDHAGFWLYYRRLERSSFQRPAGGPAPLCSPRGTSLGAGSSKRLNSNGKMPSCRPNSSFGFLFSLLRGL
ncbi:IS66 family insertion sequence element accessory protein TnpB [Paenibacillus dendritiformis]|uniref:IS66 family insertion sequence element accessory protein TnpB n=1 Tax=Paenibacillus dendritiformis TaxID=130049 RepID=UPI003B75CD48